MPPRWSTWRRSPGSSSRRGSAETPRPSSMGRTCRTRIWGAGWRRAATSLAPPSDPPASSALAVGGGRVCRGRALVPTLTARDAPVHAGAGVARVPIEHCSKLALGRLVITAAQVQDAEHQPRLQIFRVLLLGAFELLESADPVAGIPVLHAETRA